MDAAAVDKVLNEMVKTTPGLIGVLLITDDGLPIASTVQAADTEMSSTAVGAILCDAGQKGIQELGLGAVEIVVTLGTEGFFVVTKVVEGILLMAVASPEVLLGMVLLKFRKAKPLLAESLGESARRNGGHAGPSD